jgi:hypothetical protein
MMYSDLSVVHQMLTLVRFRRPCAPRRNIDEVKASESGRAWTYINKHFIEQSPWWTMPSGSDGEWEDARTIANRKAGSEKIGA